MQFVNCDHCQRATCTPDMNTWIQEWTAGTVHYLCPTCRQISAAAWPGAARREFYIDQHHLVRTRALPAAVNYPGDPVL